MFMNDDASLEAQRSESTFLHRRRLRGLEIHESWLLLAKGRRVGRNGGYGEFCRNRLTGALPVVVRSKEWSAEERSW